MRVRDIMTTNVISVSSDTSIYDADEIMGTHKVRRLPVCDKGKLAGIVSKDRILNSTSPQNVPIAIWKLPHYFFGMKVKEIMVRDVVTIAPEATVESAAILAQQKKVGILVVVDKERVVGVVTTNDFFYNILNPLLGIKQSGTRVIVHDPGDAEHMQGVLGCVSKHGVKILSLAYLEVEGIEENDFALRLDIENASKLVKDLKGLGYNAEVESS
ncbi:CBS domain-containing protein [Chloroflexota bacterium]